jgi:hypothetical protein
MAGIGAISPSMHILATDFRTLNGHSLPLSWPSGDAPYETLARFAGSTGALSWGAIVFLSRSAGQRSAKNDESRYSAQAARTVLYAPPDLREPSAALSAGTDRPSDQADRDRVW